MLFLKTTFLISVLGGIITPISYKIQYTETPMELKEYSQNSKRWEKFVKIIPGSQLSDKLKLLFSKNLTTFSKSAIENTVKQLLLDWTLDIWNNTSLYFPISHKLNRFFFGYHLYEWKAKNTINDHTWDLLKNFFIDFFFKERGWFFMANGYKNFRDFVFEEWLRNEKPTYIKEWKIKYSNSTQDTSKVMNTTGENNTYNPSIFSSRDSSDAYLWPLFETNPDYISLIQKLLKKENIPPQFWTNKLWTLSNLSTLTDGYKAGTILYLKGKYRSKNSEDISKLSLSNIVSSLSQSRSKRQVSSKFQLEDTLSNPLFLFVAEDNQSQSTHNGSTSQKNCVLVSKELFRKHFFPDNYASTAHKEPCLYSMRVINRNGTDQSLSSNSIYISREADQISFYSEIYPVDQSMNTSNNPEIEERLAQYCSDNFEILFFKFIQNKSNASESDFQLKIGSVGGEGTKNWTFSKHFSPYSSMLNLASQYIDELNVRRRYLQILKTLSQVYKHLPDSVIFKKTNGKRDSYQIQLKESSGLYSPHPHQRDFNWEGKIDSISPTDYLSRLRNISSSLPSNSGMYTSLLEFILPNKDLLNLEIWAKALHHEIYKITYPSSISNLYSNLFLRAQFETLISDNSKFISFLHSVRMEETLFETSKTEKTGEPMGIIEKLSSFYSKIDNLKDSNSTNTNGANWSKIIEKSYFIKKYLDLPMNEKVIWGPLGGAQNYKKNGETDQNKLNNLIQKSKNYFFLVNFFLNDVGYEYNSREYTDFLSYLYSIYWLNLKKHANFSKIMEYILKKSKSKNLYLVWTKKLSSSEVSSLSSSSSASSSGTSSISAFPIFEKMDSLFKDETGIDRMFNPLIGNIENLYSFKADYLTSKQTSSSQKSSSEIITFINALENELKLQISSNQNNITSSSSSSVLKFSGFQGLVTDSFLASHLPSELKENIGKAPILNSEHNKNYLNSRDSASNENHNGIHPKKFQEGLFFKYNYSLKFNSNSEISTYIDSLNSKDELMKFLILSSEGKHNYYHISPLYTALSNSEEKNKEKNTLELDQLNLKELKEKIKSILNSAPYKSSIQKDGQSSSYSEIYQLFNRFSGYLYLGSDKQIPYILTAKNADNESHWITFLYQLNKFDFKDNTNISSLSSSLSEETFNFMLSYLPLNEEIRDWISNYGLAIELNAA